VFRHIAPVRRGYKPAGSAASGRRASISACLSFSQPENIESPHEYRRNDQVAEVIVNANRNRRQYESLGIRVVADEFENFQGPLAGMASAMNAVTTPWMITVPCDSPFVPGDLVARFCSAVTSDAPVVLTAHDGKRLQPVFNLMHISVRPSVEAFLESGERKIDRWFATVSHATVDFSDAPDTFVNINTLQDRDALEERLR